MRTQLAIGTLLTAVGAADLAGLVPALADYAYPIVWWGVLLLVDAWNSAHRGLSLWRANKVRFFAITLPVSVIVWLLFEALNLPAPQWRYRTELPGIWRKVLLGFLSFSTVIPIMVESWWVVGGHQCVPAGLLTAFRKHKGLAFTLAALAAVIPFVNDVFWFNQGIWLIPALVLLPLVAIEHCPAPHFLRAMATSGLLAGLAWEGLNYRSRSHWEYLILPEVPHLFYMPLPGYLGFIPFAFSMLAVYQWQRSLKPAIWLAVVLYSFAIAGLYALMAFYLDRIWIGEPL